MRKRAASKISKLFVVKKELAGDEYFCNEKLTYMNSIFDLLGIYVKT